jgi:hypothetical protein
LGINLEVPNKAVFYNGLTGVLMVRATPEDLELIQAAIETLGGRALGQSAAAGHFSVTGKVNHEGPYEFPSGQRLALLEAIARAGGFSPTANKNKIELLRNGTKTVYSYDQLSKSSDPVWIEPDDVVVVRESFF